MIWKAFKVVLCHVLHFDVKIFWLLLLKVFYFNYLLLTIFTAPEAEFALTSLTVSDSTPPEWTVAKKCFTVFTCLLPHFTHSIYTKIYLVITNLQLDLRSSSSQHLMCVMCVIIFSISDGTFGRLALGKFSNVLYLAYLSLIFFYCTMVPSNDSTYFMQEFSFSLEI